MSLNPIFSTTPSRPVQTLRDTRGETGGAAEGESGVLSPAARTAQFNGSILQASLEVSIRSGENSLELVLRAAIEQVSVALGPDLPPPPFRPSGADNSPEATAGRIVDLATGFFGAFSAQKGDAPAEDVLEQFMELIRKGIDQGFKEARDILQGVGVLQGDTAANIDKTYDLVQEGLDWFVAGQIEQG